MINNICLVSNERKERMATKDQVPAEPKENEMVEMLDAAKVGPISTDQRTMNGGLQHIKDLGDGMQYLVVWRYDGSP